MIKKYVSDSPFNAVERFLLVPVAAETTEFESTRNGFVASVLAEFGIAQVMLKDKYSNGGFDLGEMFVVGGNSGWVRPYVLAFAGIHKHVSMGWQDAPQAITHSLSSLNERIGGLTVATAGIPGTGFSGLKGGADIEAIRQSLEDFDRDVTVYTSNDAFDRETRVNKIPLRSDALELNVTHADESVLA